MYVTTDQSENGKLKPSQAKNYYKLQIHKSKPNSATL